jgi:hypothetical protein
MRKLPRRRPSYGEAVYVFNSNEEAGIRALQKYTKVKDPDILEDAYDQFRDYLEISLCESEQMGNNSL